MKLCEVMEILGARNLTGETEQQLEQIEVLSACGSDLMSDVLAFVKDQGLLMTGLINTQVIRTAEMMDICAICFVRGKEPDESLVSLAKEHGVALFSTEHPLYVACGLLYSRGLGNAEE